ncbi:MAG: DUF6279 family lipoprotein [Rhodoferax sp.]|nr:DUF6279 family lipoprotein [Rhodoferax sp.]
MTTSTATAVSISVLPHRFDNLKRIIGLLGLALSLVLLQGCSAVKLAYNNLPELSYWWIDGYADLNEAQSLKVREELARLQQWHRANELPRIADLLQKIQRLAPIDTTPEQVCSLFAEVRNRIDTLLSQAEPATVPLAMTLTPSQLVQMEAKHNKSNAEWRKDWVNGTAAERQSKRLKAAIDRAEQFYGTLGEPQIAVLRNSIARSEFDPQLSYAERLRRQQDLLQTLRQIGPNAPAPVPTMPQVTLALRAYLERSVSSPNMVYRAYADRAVPESCKTFAQLHNSSSAEQRERAVRRLAAYERDARELAAQR